MTRFTFCLFGCICFKTPLKVHANPCMGKRAWRVHSYSFKKKIEHLTDLFIILTNLHFKLFPLKCLSTEPISTQWHSILPRHRSYGLRSRVGHGSTEYSLRALPVSPCVHEGVFTKEFLQRQECGTTETVSEAPREYGIRSCSHAARIASYETTSALVTPPWLIPLRKELLSQGLGTIWHPRPDLWNLHVWLLDGTWQTWAVYHRQW